jgi:hypothetical protein
MPICVEVNGADRLPNPMPTNVRVIPCRGWIIARPKSAGSNQQSRGSPDEVFIKPKSDNRSAVFVEFGETSIGCQNL